VHSYTMLDVIESAVLKPRKLFASCQLGSSILRWVLAVILDSSGSSSICYGLLLREMRHCGEPCPVFASRLEGPLLGLSMHLTSIIWLGM
jgi:hypothetical protein